MKDRGRGLVPVLRRPGHLFRYVTGWLVADAANAVMAEGFLADAVARYGTRLHTSHADQGGVMVSESSVQNGFHRQTIEQAGLNIASWTSARRSVRTRSRRKPTIQAKVCSTGQRTSPCPGSAGSRR